MADFKLKMIDQADSPDLKKRDLFCKWHPYAAPKNFIDVEIKKSKKIVKRCMFCQEQKGKNKMENKKVWEMEKQQLSDYYVRRTLKYGTKLKMQEFPDELVEVKRAVIKLKRLHDKLNQPLAKCSEHGDLYEDQVIKKNKLSDGSYSYRCKKCMEIYHKRHYELHKEKIKISHEKYRKANPEKVKHSKSASRLKRLLKDLKDTAVHGHLIHKYKAETVAKQKQRIERERHELTDYHVKRCLTKRAGLRIEDIPPEMVEAKRALMLLKRGIKRKKERELYLALEGKKDE